MPATNLLSWRVWISADFMADYGDATEFLAIPYAPITYFIAGRSAGASIAFLLNTLRYMRGKGPMSPDRSTTAI